MIRIATLSTLLFGLIAASSFGQTAGMVNFQGFLQGATGPPVNGSVNMEFRIFDSETAGNLIDMDGDGVTEDVCGEDVTCTPATAENGHVSVKWGPVHPSAFDGSDRWLEVSVDGAPFSRLEVVTAPAASEQVNIPATGSPALIVDGTGNIGIGTSSPTERLEISGNIHATGTIRSGNTIIIDGINDEITSTGALDINIDSGRALRLESYLAGPPNIVGGFSGNSIATGADGATIAGGGISGSVNRINQTLGAIGGGAGNTTSGNASTIAGGQSNTAGATSATVSGGFSNTAGGPYATIGGGGINSATGVWSTIAGGTRNNAGGSYATVSGGQRNAVSADYGTISGGGEATPGDATTSNEVYDEYGTVGGGGGNKAGSDDANATSAFYATIAGGKSNEASAHYGTVAGGIANTASAESTTVGGGGSNTSSGYGATVGGGDSNTASGEDSAVPGGERNTASGDFSAVAGGESNTASGSWAIAPGGSGNIAGGNHSFAAGRRAIVRDAAQVGGGDTDGDEGTFIWADCTDLDFTSTNPNQFLIRAGGGVGIGTNSPTEQLTVAGMIGSTSGGFKLPDGTIVDDASDLGGTDTLAGLSCADGEIAKWNNTLAQWECAPDNAGAAGASTLDEAYDGGGSGAGRTVTTDAGAVDIAGVGGLTVAGTIQSGGSITIDGGTDTITAASGTISLGDENVTTSGQIESTGGGFKFPDGTTQTTAASAGSGMPSGGIIMWSGSIASIPAGWALCDGTSGTPDLRNRFIVGAGNAYAVGATGGENEHTLTIAEMPSHNHTVQINDATSTGPTRKIETAGITNTYGFPTSYTGGNQPHENRPPYYALAYIMKL